MLKSDSDWRNDYEVREPEEEYTKESKDRKIGKIEDEQ